MSNLTKMIGQIAIFIMIAQCAFPQTVTPTPVAAYINSGSGWNPWTSGAGFGALGATPLSVGLFCQVSASSQWTPCAIGATGAASITSGTIDNTAIGGTTPSAGTFFPFQANGSSSSTPSTLTQITSTGSGSTTGIPSGYGCLVQHTFVSGSNYTARAMCVSNSGADAYFYSSSSAALGSESYANAVLLDHNGTLILPSTGYISSPVIYPTTTQTTVACSTSGNAIFSQPFRGSSDKKVLIHLAACVGTASYTYPTAFTNAPGCYASSLVACSVAGTPSTTAVTITGATTTGSLMLEDY